MAETSNILGMFHIQRIPEHNETVLMPFKGSVPYLISMTRCSEISSNFMDDRRDWTTPVTLLTTGIESELGLQQS